MVLGLLIIVVIKNVVLFTLWKGYWYYEFGTFYIFGDKGDKSHVLSKEIKATCLVLARRVFIDF